MKKIFLIISLFIFSQTPSFAQNDGAGNTGLSFLKLGVGAQSISMGEAYSSLTEDATSVYYNPARLFYGSKTNVYLTHNQSLLDFTNDFIAFKTSGEKFAFGIGVQRAAVNDIEIRTIPGGPVDKFNSENLAVGVSLAYMFSPGLSIGVTPKFLYEKIYVDDAAGLAFDIGTNYTKNDFSASFVIANLGSINELRHASTKLPSSVRLGASYKLTKNDFAFRFGVDGYKVLDGGKMHLHGGGEAAYKDMFFLRAGYQTNYENKSLTAGIGFKYKAFTLDYAFVPYKYEFSNSNTFSLGLNF
ncbi:MAG TPA: PorV/PorQ family protein [Ignavibacteria bacterium]|nr:PorV/PorQ family protein [Ignavibacteria bacterium]